jgi:hypothetical protein
VIDADQASQFADVAVQRADLVRNSATEAPPDISHQQVLEHGRRHLAWLMQDDAVVADRLSLGWPDVLRDYVPQPFRHL